MKYVLFTMLFIIVSCSSTKNKPIVVDKKYLVETRVEKNVTVGGKAAYLISRVLRMNKIKRNKAIAAIRNFCTKNHFSILVETHEDSVKLNKSKLGLNRNFKPGTYNLITFQCH